MGKSALLAFAVVAGAGCSVPDSGENARQDAAFATLANDVARDAAEKEMRIAALESRILALESRLDAPAEHQGAPGDWIIWKVEETRENPNQVLLSWIPPKPMAAYSTQSECVAEAIRVAVANGGSVETPTQYVRAGDYGTTVLVTFRCLPKEIDPRKLR